MQRQYPAGGQRALAVAKERLFVKGRGRADRVRQVERDVIEFLLRLRQIFQPVVDQELQLGVDERPAVDRAEMLLGDLDHLLVQLHHDDLIERRVLERFLGGSAVPAADNEDSLRRGKRGESRVNEGFVVHEFLALGGHEAAVEAKELPELGRFVDLQILEPRFRSLDELGGAQEKSVVPVQRLVHEALVARHVVLHVLLGTVEVHQVRDDLSRLGAVVRCVIADVDVEGDALELGPGVDGEMRLRQHHRAGDSATVELVEQVAEYREAGPVDGVVTKLTQRGCVSQIPCVPPATVQIRDNM